MSNLPRPDYSQIISGLSSLDRAQLEEVRRRCAYYLQHRSSSPEPVEDEDWLLAGLFAELSRRGLEQRTNFQIKKPVSFAGFQITSAAVRVVLLQACPGTTAVQRRALGEVCGYELAKFIESWSHPQVICRDTLLRHVGKVPDAIDRAYPGYLGAGLLSVVIGAKQ